MPPVAITVTDLGKQYRLGAQQAAYATLRETLMGAVRSPLRAFRRSEEPRFWAVRGVGFEVAQGEAVGIIGRNGAGKSTLLKMLSRITEPTEGRIVLHGRVGSLLEVGTGFHPELSGRENIFLNGAILGMARAEIVRKFDEIVAFAEVEKFIDTPVKHYSSGMYLRLAFAVAAHLEPEILIVDEVLAVGDAEFQKKCLGKMDDASKKEGRTVLFVSHNMGAVNSLCSRAILLSEGSILEQGDVSPVVQLYLAGSSRRKKGLHYVATAATDRPAYIKEVNLKGSEQFGEGLFDVHTQLTLSLRVVITEPISGTTPYFDLKCNNEVVYRSFASDGDANILEGIKP